MEGNRNASIDILRGLTMMGMTIVNNPGSWSHIYAPLEHAEWHGCTPTDLVFPFFAFIMCVSIPFSGDAGLTFTKILTRTIRIFCLGLFLSFFSKINLGLEPGPTLMLLRLAISIGVAYALLGNFSEKVKLYLAIALLIIMLGLAYSGLEAFAAVRIPGVLQRLALIYFAVALLKPRLSVNNILYMSGGILMAYWALMVYVPFDGKGLDHFVKGNNLAAFIDNLLLPGHLWATSKTWDPEGILSTLPAIGTGLLGLWAGYKIKQNANNLNLVLGIGGIGLIGIGLAWHTVFPINKALWTSSYVLYSAGWAMVVFTGIRLVFSNLNLSGVQNYLTIWGVNPMLVFFASGIIPRALNMLTWGPEAKGTIDYIYSNAIVPLFANPKMASFAGALVYICIWSVILLLLKRKNLIFKV